MKGTQSILLVALALVASPLALAAPVERSMEASTSKSTVDTLVTRRADTLPLPLRLKARNIRKHGRMSPSERRRRSVCKRGPNASSANNAVPGPMKRDLAPELSAMSISDLQELQQMATDAEALQLQRNSTEPAAHSDLDLSGLLGGLIPLATGLAGTAGGLAGSILGALPLPAGLTSTVTGVAQQVNTVLLPLVEGLVNTVVQTASGLPIVGPEVASLANTVDVDGTLKQVGELEGSLLSGLLGGSTGSSSSSSPSPASAAKPLSAEDTSPHVNLSLPVAPADSANHDDGDQSF